MASVEKFVIPGMRICAAQENFHSGLLHEQCGRNFAIWAIFFWRWAHFFLKNFLPTDLGAIFSKISP
jgi:hypothetical protein